jgi:hypothetical protein
VSSTPRDRATSASATSRTADLPLGAQVPGVLRRVGVADHHLAATDGVEQLGVDLRCRPQRLDRLEERHDRQRLVGQLVHATDVVGGVGAGDDPRVERLRPVAPARLGDGCRDPAHAFVRLDEVARVRAHVELGEMQAEELDPAAQRRECPVGDARTAVRAQAPVDDREIVREVVCRRVPVGVEPIPHERELAPVRLVEVLVADRVCVLRQLALVSLDRREQRIVDGRQARRTRRSPRRVHAPRRGTGAGAGAARARAPP